MRDENKISVDAQQRLSRPNIYIYTSSGILLSEIPVSDVPLNYCLLLKMLCFSGLAVGCVLLDGLIQRN